MGRDPPSHSEAQLLFFPIVGGFLCLLLPPLRVLPLRFEGRLLIIETTIADAWGRVMSRCSGVGRPIGVTDAFFAATAEVHALTLVTRNVSDFTASGIFLFNPWS